MNLRLLTSRENPVLKSFRSAAAQTRSAPEEVVVAEGVRVIEEAVRSGNDITTLLVTERFGESDRERDLLEACERARARMYRVADRLFKTVTGVVTPQGAIALVRVPAALLPEALRRPDPLFLCCCGIQDPGNLGSLIRSSAAAGCAMLCTTAGTVSARNPKTIRSSAGAFFRIPIVEGLEPDEVLDRCAAERISLYRTCASDGKDFAEIPLTGAAGILLGNEAQGFHAGVWSRLPALRIPMAAGIESLNVAAAGAIIVFEAARQRRAAANVRPVPSPVREQTT